MKYSKLSNYKIKKLLQCFCEDLTATQTTNLLSLNRNTVNRYYNFFRKKIVQYQKSINKEFLNREMELDESYFGGRNKGNRGRGTAKVPVFGILKRNSKVYTQIIKNASRSQIRPIIQKIIKPSSVVYIDKWRAYDSLVLNGYKHYRINHQLNEFSKGKGNHINGIENFWSFAKRRLSKFNGIRKKNFYLYLKECEFRYNHSTEKLYHKLREIIKIF